MNAQKFKKYQDKLKEVEAKIDKALEDKIGEDFSDWIFVVSMDEVDDKFKNLLSATYINKGWDIEIRNECENYHDVAYVDNVYLRYREEI